MQTDHPANLNHSRPNTRWLNWQQEYLHLTALLMTVCWLAPWLTLSLGWFLDISLDNALKFSTVHLSVSVVFVRWMRHYRREQYLRWIALALTLVAVGASLLLAPSFTRAHGGENAITSGDLFHFTRYERIPAGPILILWVLFLWRRGYDLGSQDYISIVRASFGLRLGILSFLWVSIFADSTLRQGILVLVPYFFFFGLLSSSLARANSLNLDRPAHSRAFGRGWMLSLFGVTLVITFGGYAVALWMAGIDTDRIAETSGSVSEVLLRLIFVIASPILFLAQIIFDFVNSLFPDTHRQVFKPSGNSRGSGGLNLPWLMDIIEFVAYAIAVGIALMLVFMLLAFLWFLFIARDDQQDGRDEERESLGTGEVVGGLRRSLRDSWRRLFDTLGIFRQFGLGRDLFAALTIRRIYAQMERLAARRGYPRAISQTPYEYRRQLFQAFPGLDNEIQHITEAYIAVRYGEVPETDTELQAVRAAWQHLQESPEPTF